MAGPYVDTDMRGDTCWIVLVDGDDVGWVRYSRDAWVATVKWTGRRRRRVGTAPMTAELPDLDAAIAWVVERRGSSS